MVLPDLPICDVLPALLRALTYDGVAVLQTPPGAGKTTVVPLALLDADLTGKRIIMLEPRRLAARASAERMARTIGEKVGETVGYRIRGEARVSSATRIEVVTEGILTRMVQADPALAGIGAVLFDEFHERSLNADLGLALVNETRQVLRDDLIVLVMSATLDAAPVGRMLAAPVITSSGRAFPVETRWLARPVDTSLRTEAAVAELVETAWTDTDGGILVFLPGEGEIRRVEALLRNRLPPKTQVFPLFGAMDFTAQRAALGPSGNQRKIVLATAIAETSLTIPDIRVVVDAGLARRARFDAGSGMSRLVTERVSLAEADQRRGRAGRVAPGVCYRLWTRAQEGGFPGFPPAEIEVGDLTGLVLDLALWGARTTEGMAFLTPPNPGAFSAAQSLLRDLSALDGAGAITDHGKTLATIPLHPRLAHMLVNGGKGAALLAALLAERDPLRAASVDLLLRREALADPTRFSQVDRRAISRIRTEAGRLRRHEKPEGPTSWSALTALAYPDRIGMRRQGEAPRWLLSGGTGAVMDASDPLARAKFLVVTNLDGNRRDAKIRQAIEISEAELRTVLADQITSEKVCHWSRRARRVVARQVEKLGALTLSERVWNDAPGDLLAQAALAGIREIGLPMSNSDLAFASRVERLRQAHPDLPDMSQSALLDSLEDWLLPHLGPIRTETDIRAMDISGPLRARLDWQQSQTVDRLSPTHFTTPTGRKVVIDYTGAAPEISVRLQEMFGETTHPSIAGIPLRITLLSPANRPLQTTTDLPGFWASSYADVRKDMRGRYPKHPWPEDPTQATPTVRAKPRKR